MRKRKSHSAEVPFSQSLTLELAVIVQVVRFGSVGSQRDETGERHHAKCYYCDGLSDETADDCIKAYDLPISHKRVDCIGKLVLQLENRRDADKELGRIMLAATDERMNPTTPTGEAAREGHDFREERSRLRDLERARQERPEAGAAASAASEEASHGPS